uniref:Gap junction protein n=1 Tax=Fundulus heteroclitus TaxID=8078 RepID=A0A3Q2PSM0_FUNHE
MGHLNFLGGILEEVHIHSTPVGKTWLTILFICRMLVIGVAADDVWTDEQAEFICNTHQPGCRNACYDLAFPISPIRYWVLQVISVSSPSLVYVGHALYRLSALEKVRERKKPLARKRIEREIKQLCQEQLNKAPLRGSLMRTYVAHIIIRSVVEGAFMTGQYLLYGFHLHTLFRCEQDPCPNSVDCFVSRPTEKSIYMVFMQSIAVLSLFLSILEIIHLICKKIDKVFTRTTVDKDNLSLKESRQDTVVQTCNNASRNAKYVSEACDHNLKESMHIPNMCPRITKPSTYMLLWPHDIRSILLVTLYMYKIKTPPKNSIKNPLESIKKLFSGQTC